MLNNDVSFENKLQLVRLNKTPRNLSDGIVHAYSKLKERKAAFVQIKSRSGNIEHDRQPTGLFAIAYLATAILTVEHNIVLPYQRVGEGRASQLLRW